MSFKSITLAFMMYLLLTGDILLTSNVAHRLYITQSKAFRKLWASQGNNNFVRNGNFMKYLCKFSKI